MSLDDFLRSCKEKGYTPLNYSRKTKFADGSEYEEEFSGAGYAGFSGHKGRKNGYGSGEESRQKSSQYERDKRIDDVVSELYGSEVVIRTRDGYHHGELKGYDGKFFYLKGYCFSKELMDTFEYGAKSIFSEDAVVPARDIVSVGEIPMVTGKFADIQGEEEGDESEFKFRL